MSRTAARATTLAYLHKLSWFTCKCGPTSTYIRYFKCEEAHSEEAHSITGNFGKHFMLAPLCNHWSRSYRILGLLLLGSLNCKLDLAPYSACFRLNLRTFLLIFCSPSSPSSAIAGICMPLRWYPTRFIPPQFQQVSKFACPSDH